MQWVTSRIVFQVFGIVSFFLLVLSYYSIIYVSAWCPAGFVPFVTCLNVHMSPISIILVELSAPGFYFDFTVFQQDLMCKTFSHIHVSHRFLGIAYISTRLLRLTEKEKCEQHFLKISLSSRNSTSKLEQTWLTHCSQSPPFSSFALNVASSSSFLSNYASLMFFFGWTESVVRNPGAVL